MKEHFNRDILDSSVWILLQFIEKCNLELMSYEQQLHTYRHTSVKTLLLLLFHLLKLSI